MPMYVIIGVWGGDNRIYAAIKFFLYTFAASLLMLVALVYLYYAADGRFGIFDWHQVRLGMTAQTLLLVAFFAAFAVKVPMGPVHTWLPDAHVEAPTGRSIILAAIMLKLGAYGFLRFPASDRPDASGRAGAVRDRSVADCRRLHRPRGAGAVGHEEVGGVLVDRAHGLQHAGLFIFNPLGMAGGIVQMISHGFVSGAMFFCIGVMYDRMHSRSIADYGGVVNTMPRFAAFFMLFVMANAGLPATSDLSASSW